MVFNPPTSFDYDNATRYAYERGKLAIFNHFLKIKPHIFSHVNVEIRHNPDLSNRTLDQMNHNISVRLIGTPMFCSQVKCNAYYPRGKTCTPSTDPLVFKSGNTDVQACQAGCFNLHDNSPDANGNVFKGPHTTFSERQNCCLLWLDQFFILGVDDYSRTDVHPEPRVDTIGTGFDLSADPYIDKDGNETFKFLLNKYYCDDFRLKFDGVECKRSVGEAISGFLFSEVLYKSLQYGIRKASNGIGAYDVQKPILPEISLLPSADKQAWLQNINQNVNFFNPELVLSDIGIMGDYPHLIFTTEYGWPGRIVQPLIITRVPKFSQYQEVDFIAIDKNVLPHLKRNSYGRRQLDEFEILQTYTSLLRAINSKKNDTESTISQIVNGIVEIFGTSQFWLQSSLILTQSCLSEMEKLVLYGSVHFKAATESFTAILRRTMFTSLAHQTGHLAAHYTETAARIALGSIKAISIIGIVSDIIGLIDVVLGPFDFFSTEKLNYHAPHQYSKADLEMKKTIFDYKTVEYSPAMFVHNDDLITASTINASHLFQQKLVNSIYLNLLPASIKLPYAIDSSAVIHKDDTKQTFKWNADYLTRLERNSNDLLINWSDESGVTFEDYKTQLQKEVKTIPDTYVNYREYIGDTLTRLDINKYGIPITMLILISSVFLPTLLPVVIAIFIAVFIFSLQFMPLSRIFPMKIRQ